MVDFNIESQDGQKDDGLTRGQASGFFRKGPTKTAPFDASADISTLMERVRVLEDHVGNLRKKSQLTDQTVLDSQKRLGDELRLLNTDIGQLHRSLDDVKEKIRLIIKELSECSKKEDVAILQKYISFWEPVNFVTRNELDKALDEISEKPDAARQAKQARSGAQVGSASSSSSGPASSTRSKEKV